MTVHADRMRENLNATHGALYSQRALLALVEAGRSRDDAYRIVQEAAQRAWDERNRVPRAAGARPRRSWISTRCSTPRRSCATRTTIVGAPGPHRIASSRARDRLMRHRCPRRWGQGGPSAPTPQRGAASAAVRRRRRAARPPRRKRVRRVSPRRRRLGRQAVPEAGVQAPRRARAAELPADPVRRRSHAAGPPGVPALTSPIADLLRRVRRRARPSGCSGARASAPRPATPRRSPRSACTARSPRSRARPAPPTLTGRRADRRGRQPARARGRLRPRPPLVARPDGAHRPAARRAHDARLARLVRDLERRRRPAEPDARAERAVPPATRSARSTQLAHDVTARPGDDRLAQPRPEHALEPERELRARADGAVHARRRPRRVHRAGRARARPRAHRVRRATGATSSGCTTSATSPTATTTATRRSSARPARGPGSRRVRDCACGTRSTRRSSSASCGATSSRRRPTAPTAAALEALYVASGYQIRPVVEAILLHPDLYTRPARWSSRRWCSSPGLLRALRGGRRRRALGLVLASAPASGSSTRRTSRAGTTALARHVDGARAAASRRRARCSDRVLDGDRGRRLRRDRDARGGRRRGARLGGDPELTAETRRLLTAFAAQRAGGRRRLAAQRRYRGLRQNALRHLIATSPDFQTC